MGPSPVVARTADAGLRDPSAPNTTAAMATPTRNRLRRPVGDEVWREPRPEDCPLPNGPYKLARISRLLSPRRRFGPPVPPDSSLCDERGGATLGSMKSRPLVF